MAELTIDQAKKVYLTAIDPKASHADDPDWWSEIVKEVREVCSSRSDKAGASVIEWWHNDWSSVGDSAITASRRIRQAAKHIRME